MPRHPLPRLPRNWLITGASSHLGGLLAERVALQGDRVVLVGEERAPLVELAECYPGRVLPLVRDHAQPGAAEAWCFMRWRGRREDALVIASCGASPRARPPRMPRWPSSR